MVDALGNSLQNNNTDDDKLDSDTFWKYVGRFILYIFIVLMFVMNLCAVSIALQLNRGKNIFTKLFAAMFAFFFGIFYIIINVYYYRIKVLGNGSLIILCSENIFPI